MGTHMKTTVDIADALLLDAKREAQRSGVTLRELIEAGLRRILEERVAAERKPFKLKDGRDFRSRLHPDIRPGDWEQIRDIIYGFDRLGDDE
jgi:hypothetical protein